MLISKILISFIFMKGVLSIPIKVYENTNHDYLKAESRSKTDDSDFEKFLDSLSEPPPDQFNPVQPAQNKNENLNNPAPVTYPAPSSSQSTTTTLNKNVDAITNDDKHDKVFLEDASGKRKESDILFDTHKKDFGPDSDSFLTASLNYDGINKGTRSKDINQQTESYKKDDLFLSTGEDGKDVIRNYKDLYASIGSGTDLPYTTDFDTELDSIFNVNNHRNNKESVNTNLFMEEMNKSGKPHNEDLFLSDNKKSNVGAHRDEEGLFMSNNNKNVNKEDERDLFFTKDKKNSGVGHKEDVGDLFMTNNNRDKTVNHKENVDDLFFIKDKKNSAAVGHNEDVGDLFTTNNNRDKVVNHKEDVDGLFLTKDTLAHNKNEDLFMTNNKHNNENVDDLFKTDNKKDKFGAHKGDEDLFMSNNNRDKVNHKEDVDGLFVTKDTLAHNKNEDLFMTNNKHNNENVDDLFMTDNKKDKIGAHKEIDDTLFTSNNKENKVMNHKENVDDLFVTKDNKNNALAHNKNEDLLMTNNDNNKVTHNNLFTNTEENKTDYKDEINDMQTHEKKDEELGFFGKIIISLLDGFQRLTGIGNNPDIHTEDKTKNTLNEEVYKKPYGTEVPKMKEPIKHEDNYEINNQYKYEPKGDREVVKNNEFYGKSYGEYEYPGEYVKNNEFNGKLNGEYPGEYPNRVGYHRRIPPMKYNGHKDGNFGDEPTYPYTIPIIPIPTSWYGRGGRVGLYTR